MDMNFAGICGYRAATRRAISKPCIVWLARAEKNFKLGIILHEEARQVRFQIRFSARQRFQQSEWRSESGPFAELAFGRSPLAKIARHRRQNHAGKDRGSNEAEDRDG